MTNFLKSLSILSVILIGFLFSQNNFVFAQGLPPTITYNGQLVDGSGTGIANAQISLVGSSASSQVYTDANGDFSFTVPTGTYTITVNNRGGVTYANAPSQFNVQSQITLNGNLTQNLTLPSIALNVTLLDTNNNPSSGSTVQTLSGTGTYQSFELYPGGGQAFVSSTQDSKTTNSSGVASLITLPVSGVTLAAFTAAGRTDFSGVTAINNPTNVTETVPAVVTYNGQLVDGSGTGIANAQISLVGSSASSQVYTDANGDFSFTVPTGTYTITVNNRGGVTYANAPSQFNVQSQITLNGNLTQNLTLPSIALNVTLLDTNNNPSSGSTVQTLSGTGTYQSFELYPGGGQAFVSSTQDIKTTNSSGVASLITLPVSNVTLAAFVNNTRYDFPNITALSNTSITIGEPTPTPEQPPTTTATLSPAPFSDGTYHDPTTVTLSATATSGYTIANTYYTIDGGTQQAYTTPFTITGAGNHTITYWSVDNSGVTESPNTKTFTISDAYTLNGTVYNDNNQNGSQDQGESGYTDATVTVSQNNQTIASTTTDSNGNYTFSNLETGNYTVTLTVPSGYTATTTNPISFSLMANTTENFGIVHVAPTTIATLSPSPFSDGTYHDPTTVTLSATAASGFSIANTYYTIDRGTQQTYNTPFTVTGAGNHTITYWSVDNSGVTEAANTKTFTITEAYNITGTVYIDANQNGVQDPGEQGYANATVTVSQNNQTVASTTTNSSGNYTFSNLEAGTYTETLTVPNGYFTTTTNPVNVALTVNTTQNFGIAPNIPVIRSITFTPTQATINSAVSASASFTSSDPTDTAKWNWGDGNTTTGTVTENNDSGSVTNNHTYTTLGSYTVTLTVTNAIGESSTSQAVIAVIPTNGLHGSNLSHTNYSGANLSNQNISNANLSNATFNNVDFQNANLSQVNGSNSSFTNDNFTSANLDKVNFSNSNLTGSNFTNAILTQANLSNSNLTNVNFTGADLQGANLSGTTKTGITWSNTTCPNGTNSNNDNNTCIGQGGGL